jgi:hypothetical protein
MSRTHKGSWRDDSACQDSTCSADGLLLDSYSTEGEPAKGLHAQDVCTQIMNARSRSSILAPHVGNCSRAVLLGVGDM